MESAPRGDAPLLCLTRFGEYEIANWDGVVGCWISRRGFLIDPVLWRRLPKPPADFSPGA